TLIYHSAAGAEFATVIVGYEKKTFTIHKDLLIHYSDFFRAALAGQFREVHENTVKLPEDEPLYFEIFVHWLYYQRFLHKDMGDDADLLAQLTMEDGAVDADTFIYLYVFADKYKVSQFLHESITGMLFAINDHRNASLPGPVAINDALSSLDVTSPMCRLIVELIAYW
ncbi:hypothetical protein EK21DRAFT_47537, partial [Setomelanomma holmii]